MKKALMIICALAACMLPFGAFATENDADVGISTTAENVMVQETAEEDGHSDEESYSVSSPYLKGLFIQRMIPQGTTIMVNAEHMIPSKGEKTPVENAEIMIDGRKTGIRTDASGRAMVTLYETGKHRLSADFTPFGYSDGKALDYTVAPAKDAVNVRVVIRFFNQKAEKAILDKIMSVTDLDEDGRVTSEDALRLAHRCYYDQGGEFAGMNQNRVWGRNGRFLCKVIDADGNTVHCGNAVGKSAVHCDLSDGCTVTIRPKDHLDEMYAPRWNASSLNVCEPTFRMGDAVTVNALHFLPDKADGQPIEQIEILIDDKETGIFTDENGQAVIPMDMPGEHRLSLKVKGLFAEKSECLWYSVSEESVTTEIRREVIRQPANAPVSLTQKAVETENTQSGGAGTGENTPIAPLAFAALTAISGTVIVARKKD